MREMKTDMNILSAIAAALFATCSAAAGAQHAEPREYQWYRGNSHVHTTNSDGNASPSDVARWYRDHGYAFVVITDHERVTDVAPLNAEFALPGRFLVISGEEVTQQIVDPSHASGRRQAHVNGLGLSSAVKPIGPGGVAEGISMAASFRRNVGAIIAAGGVAQVNHPNFRWSVGLDDLLALPDSTLFEVWNAQPGVNNLGGSDGIGKAALSTEALWDSVLSRGKLIYGVASDDAHKFRPEQLEDFSATRPGGGWIMVWANSLTPAAINKALRKGDFYSSTGVVLRSYQANSRSIAIEIANPWGPRDDRRFVTSFIGIGGRILAQVPGRNPSYTIRGREGYVRAVITDSNGRMAWAQPVWVERVLHSRY